MELIEITPSRLTEYASIPIGFWVDSRFEVDELDYGLGGLMLREVPVSPPYYKDYDAQDPQAGPVFWPDQFDVARWGFFLALVDGIPMGGAAVALNTAGASILEDRPDLAVLWDIRVRPDHRHRGIGRALLRRACQWAQARKCRQLKIETQNVNVAACRFYAGMDCRLGMIHRFGYAGVPGCENEVMLCWYLELG